MQLVRFLSLFFVGLLCASCSDNKPKHATSERVFETKIDWTITNKGIARIRPGNLISDVQLELIRNLEKDNGQIDNSKFEILKSGKVVGSFLRSFTNEREIGTVLITDSSLRTKEGVGVGSSYEEIKRLIPHHSFYVSALTNIVTIENDKIEMDLNFESTDLNILKNAIPDTAKVKAIWVN